MKKLYVGLITFLIIFSSCQVNKINQSNSIDKTTQTAPISNKLKVVTTLFPVYDFLNNLAGDKIELHLLLKPGIEAHSYEPVASDIIKVNEADLFVYTSEAMEPWADSIITNTKTEKLALDSVVDLISNDIAYYDIAYYDDDREHIDEDNENQNEHQHEQSDIDPHFWLSLNNDIKIVNKLTAVLIQKDAINKDFYQNNSQLYQNKLQNLHNNYQSKFINCQQDQIASSGHDVFAYLARDYNFTVITAQDLSPNSEITPQKIKTIIDLVKANKIKYIFTENLANTQLADTLMSELSVEILLFNPLANLSQTDFDNNRHFIDLMTDNLNNLLLALECQ